MTGRYFVFVVKHMHRTLVSNTTFDIESDCLKNRESSDSFEKFDIFILCIKDPCGELFSKITLKSLVDFYFRRNREKLKFPSDG